MKFVHPTVLLISNNSNEYHNYKSQKHEFISLIFIDRLTSNVMKVSQTFNMNYF